MQLDLESNKAESVQGRTALALAHLHRIDPEANMARRRLEEYESDHIRAGLKRDLEGLARRQAADFHR